MVDDTMSDAAKIDILVAGIDKNIRKQLLNVSVWPIAGLRDLTKHAVNIERLNNVNRLMDSPKLERNTDDSYQERKCQNDRDYNRYTKH